MTIEQSLAEIQAEFNRMDKYAAELEVENRKLEARNDELTIENEALKNFIEDEGLKSKAPKTGPKADPKTTDEWLDDALLQIRSAGKLLKSVIRNLQ